MFVLIKHYFHTLLHKWHVHRFIWRTCWALLKRSWRHDSSKFGEEEAFTFAEVNDKIKGLEYGSEEYYEQLDMLQVALDHHYAHNSHHPEHYENGLEDMDLLDVLEMLCDWQAATLRHDDGSIFGSINHNAERFDYDEKTAEKFRRFINEING